MTRPLQQTSTGPSSPPNLAGPAGEYDSRPPRRASGSDDPSEFAAQFRVLIVEDEWFIALESEAVLRNAGYAVVGVAATAEDAVAIASREKPDLVLMDIRLRGKRDGIEAALEIKERFAIPFVFATAHNEAQMRDRGAAAQPRAWLTKPYSDQQLLRAVKAALARLD